MIRQPVECIVRVNGREISDLYAQLSGVRVNMSRSSASACELVLDTIRREDGEWIVQDSGYFIPWKTIRIEARFGDRIEEVMRGYIKEVRVEHPQDMSGAKVTVIGQDETILMDREQIKRVWSTSDDPKTDGQIVEQIAKEFGLNASPETGLTNTGLSSDGTIIQILKDRADANGYELYVRTGELHFHPPELDSSPQPPIMVYAGRSTNCLNFSVKFDGHRPDEVRLIRQDENGKSTVQESFKPDLSILGETHVTSENLGLPPFAWNMDQPNGATADEVRARALAKANENDWKVVGEGELDGALYGHVLLTHRTVIVDGVGSTYGGLYYVDEVAHSFSLDGYRQTFKLIRNAVGEESSNKCEDVLASVR